MNSIGKANEKELVVAIKEIVNENKYLKRENRELIEELNAEEDCNAILEHVNKKLKKVLKLLKGKGLGVEVLTEKLKTGERFEHFHITFQCNCLETITREEYELLEEVIYGTK